MTQQTQPAIRIRAMEPEDLDALYQIENDRQLWNVGATNVPYSRYALHDFIAQSSGDIYTDRQVRLIIEDCRLGTTIGLVDLTNFDPAHRRAEVGIVIQNTFRQKGYAHAALNDIHDYAHRVLHLHQLYAVIGTDNVRACQLFTRMGYTATATLTDWLYDGQHYDNAVVMQLILKKEAEKFGG